MKTVLVVEDDDHLRRLFRLLLSAQGYTVAEAQDGEEGLRKALTARPDCIVSDAMMPRMGGLEMLRRLRRERPGGPPAIFVTAAAQMPSAEERAAAGIEEVVAKPFDFDQVIAAVRHWAGPAK